MKNTNRISLPSGSIIFFLINIPILYLSFLISEKIRLNPPGHSAAFIFSLLVFLYPIIAALFLNVYSSLSEILKIKNILFISAPLSFSPLILYFFKIYIPISLCLSYFIIFLFISLAASVIFSGKGEKEKNKKKTAYFPCIILLLSEALFALSARFIGKLESTFLRNRVDEGIIILAILSVSLFLASALSAGKINLSESFRRILSGRGIKIILVILYIFIPVVIFFTALDAMPHIQDEVAYLFQAKVLASGKIYAQSPPIPKFFDYEFIVTDGAKWYGKYFAGSSLLLAAGILFNVPWLINPLLGAIAVFLFYLFLKENTDSNSSSLMLILPLFSPFLIFIDASYLSHTSCLFFLTLFLYSFFKTVNNKTYLSSFIEGVALGCAFNIRPLTAVTFSAPFIIYGFILLLRKKINLKNVILFIIPFALLLGFFLLYNSLLTGDMLLTPFNKYCPTDRLGFGEDIGLPYLAEYGHSFSDGWVNTRANLKELSSDILGFPRLFLLVALVPFVFARAGILEYLFLSSIILNMAGYFCYYFNGIAFGPRYYFETILMLLFLIARGFLILHEFVKRTLHNVSAFDMNRASYLITPFFLLILLFYSAGTSFPEKISFYSSRYWNMDKTLENTVKKSGIHDALVFIRSGYYRNGEAAPNYYGAGFIQNDIELKNDIIYARDFGDEENLKLMKLYPERKAYRFVYNESLITANRYYDEDTSPLLYEMPKPELQSSPMLLFVHYP